MDNAPHIKHIVPDRSYANVVKKETHRLAVSMRFTPKRLAETDIIVSEIISNNSKHAIEGELLVKAFCDMNERCGLELISIDRGPGIGNLGEMLKDGISTTRTLGSGLGAIMRLSDEFDIYSLPGWGTILLSRIYLTGKNEKKNDSRISVNAVMLPKKGEVLCGDGWTVSRKSFEYKLIALDGLGHGPEANKASVKATNEFLTINQATPAETIRILHEKINKTRGAVGMVMHFNSLTNMISYAGLGNISARIIGFDKNKNCISYNGIIGHTIPNTVHTNQTTLQYNETLIIHSDGLKSRWELNHLPNILNHDGSVIAGAIYKDFSRNTDDLLIIVLKPIKNENRSR
jgi:anti-sigma regulatory factor (Ser/Thr protein kinase)